MIDDKKKNMDIEEDEDKTTGGIAENTGELGGESSDQSESGFGDDISMTGDDTGLTDDSDEEAGEGKA